MRPVNKNRSANQKVAFDIVSTRPKPPVLASCAVVAHGKELVFVTVVPFFKMKHGRFLIAFSRKDRVRGFAVP